MEEYDPALFQRIRKLVSEGKWHIIGGWTLQPDCLLPSGESFVRQMLYGRAYFKEKFGVEPETAFNIDSFGHARGMVQIMQQAGYRYYVFMRPESNRMAHLPQLFEWKGYDEDSGIIGYRLNTPYNTLMGKAAETIRQFIDENEDAPVAMRCWGIGNHGGGPSRKDVEDIQQLMEDLREKVDIRHSTPEAFFADRLSGEETLPVIREDLIPSWVGSYSTLVEIKQLHRRLENALISAEKLSVTAQEAIGLPYPSDILKEAYDVLATLQFHDVLPGTCVPSAAQEALRIGNYGLELAERIHTKAVFHLTANEKAAQSGDIPFFVWNPHPYPVEDIIECEFMLSDQNWADSCTMVHAYSEGKELPCQIIKEESNMNLDWRKRAAIRVACRPMSLTRIDLKTYTAQKPCFTLGENGIFTFDNGEMKVRINRFTGLVDSFCIEGQELVNPGAFRLEVFTDTADPWRVDTDRIDEKKGEYTLLSGSQAAGMAGVKEKDFLPVRMIEDGPVFTRVEALFGYENSRARLVYTLPKKGKDFRVDITSFFAEKDTCLRMTVPTAMEAPAFRGQSVFGDKPLYDDGRESASQKWIAASENGRSLILINDGTYASSNCGNLLRQTLLRSCGYAGHPLGSRPFMEYNRYLPRAEQGERTFRFRVAGVCGSAWLTQAEHLAAVENERLLAYNVFPGGGGQTLLPGITFSDSRFRPWSFRKR